MTSLPEAPPASGIAEVALAHLSSPAVIYSHILQPVGSNRPRSIGRRYPTPHETMISLQTLPGGSGIKLLRLGVRLSFFLVGLSLLSWEDMKKICGMLSEISPREWSCSCFTFDLAS